MAKKIRLTFDPDKDTHFIVISCQKKDYHVAYSINKACGIDLRRIKDLSFPALKGNRDDTFTLFYYEDHDRLNVYFLISNRGTEGRLIPALGNADYFMLVSGSLPDAEKEEMVRVVRGIKSVLGAFQVKMGEVKSGELIMATLELHLIEINRRSRD